MKYSKQRELVLQAVRKNKIHPTAEYIYSYLKPILPTISLATVYRNLNQLAEAGIIKRLTLGDGVDRFDADIHAHHHMYCTTCRSVIDVDAEVDVKFSEDGEKENGYHITGYDVTFMGQCPGCMKKAEVSVASV